MEADNMLEEDIGEILSRAGRSAGNEMRGFGESVHKHGNCVILSLSLG
jgi:hypothetical protein